MCLKKSIHSLCWLLALLMTGGMCLPVSAAVRITEFMAVNTRTVADEDGHFSDWLELQNVGAEPVDLAGWMLTDDATEPWKWICPGRILAPGEACLVFASGKDRRPPSGEWHTSFKLRSEHGYLALVEPDGMTVAHAFSQYPLQRADIAFGTAMTKTVLIQAGGAPVQAHVPADDALGGLWRQPDFEPGPDWTAGETAVGFCVDAPDTLPPGLVSYWPLAGDVDDGVGGNHGDFEGAANPTFVQGPDGEAGTALHFDGLNDYLAVPHVEGLPISTQPAFSISLWVKGPPQPDRRVFAEGSSSNNSPVFCMGVDNTGNTGAVDLYIRTGTGQVLLSHQHSHGVAFDNQWHHIAWVDDDGDAALYIDGQRDGADFSYTRQGMSLNRTCIGGILRASDSYHFDGAIAGVSLWNRLLTESEIQALAQGNAPFNLGAGAFKAAIALDVEDALHETNSTLYLRVPFLYEQGEPFDVLTLSMQYDDGFVAYLNGTEVARDNAPAGLDWQAAATAPRPGDQVFDWETFSLTDKQHLLQDGVNVLAIHGLNDAADDADCLISPSLSGYGLTQADGLYLVTPTPGEANEDVGLRFMPPVEASHDHGLYDEPFQLSLTSDTPGADIVYTLNGDEPTLSDGLPYTGPVQVDTTTILRAAAFKAECLPAPSITRTYIFPAHVVRQVEPAGFPGQWENFQADYDMDPDIVDDPDYQAALETAWSDIPTMSLVMQHDDFYGSGGIYMHPRQSGLEKPGSVEFFDPREGTGFQVNAGIRISGNRSRSASPKHGFRLVFRGRYGPTQLRFPLFPDTPVDRFNTLVARVNAFDSWVSDNSGQRQGATYLRDHWVRSAQCATGQVSNHGLFVHMYINGLYWGIYNLVERPDAAFGASYLGGEQDAYDAVKNHEEVVDGNINAYRTLDQLRAAGLGSSQAYEDVQGYLNLYSLSDYMIVNMFAPSTDWPGNYYMFRERVDGGQFHLVSWDSEYAFLGGVTNNRTVAHWRDDDSPTKFYHALRANSEFRLLFADRLRRHFYNGGILMPDAVTKRWLDMADQLEGPLVCEAARWGDYRRSAPYRPDMEWAAERQYLVNDYFPRRSNIVLGQFKSQGMYPTLPVPAFNQHGGTVSEGFQLVITASSGEIYYTLTGEDPRLPGGGLSPEALLYRDDASVLLAMSCHVKARVRSGNVWSALNEAAFCVDAPLQAIRVTEIMYHPMETGDLPSDEYEFIELKNIEDVRLDLSGLQLAGGIRYTFGQGSFLDPGAFAVLAANPQAVSERYPGVVVSGAYNRRLANGGERIQLIGPDGAVLMEVAYDDVGPWPELADGRGHSLVPASAVPPLDQDDVYAWRPSAFPGGSPGADDERWKPVAPAIVLDLEPAAVFSGERALFRIRAQAYPMPTFQWQKNDVPIPGATGSSYRTDPVTEGDDGAVFLCLVTNAAGVATSRVVMLQVLVPGHAPFVRGDANDDGVVDLSDAITVLLVLFAGETAACADACDANDDGAMDLADTIALLDFLFAHGDVPGAPYPVCGADATADPLTCDSHEACR